MIEAKEVRTVKEVMACDVSPVAMGLYPSLSQLPRLHVSMQILNKRSCSEPLLVLWSLKKSSIELESLSLSVIFKMHCGHCDNVTSPCWTVVSSDRSSYCDSVLLEIRRAPTFWDFSISANICSFLWFYDIYEISEIYDIYDMYDIISTGNVVLFSAVKNDI